MVIDDEPTALPIDAALLRTGATSVLRAQDPLDRFAEICSRAARNEQVVELSASVTIIGHYNEA